MPCNSKIHILPTPSSHKWLHLLSLSLSLFFLLYGILIINMLFLKILLVLSASIVAARISIDHHSHTSIRRSPVREKVALLRGMGSGDLGPVIEARTQEMNPLRFLARRGITNIPIPCRGQGMSNKNCEKYMSWDPDSREEKPQYCQSCVEHKQETRR